MVTTGLSIRPVHKEQPPGYRFSASCYDHFQLILPRRGSLACTVCERVTTAGAGDVVVLRRGGPVALRCDRDGYAGLGVNALGNLPDWMHGECTVLHPAPPVLRLADALVELMRPASPADAPLLHHACLALCHGVLDPRPEPEGDPLVERARLRLEQHLGTARPVGEILADFGLSYRQLARRFRAATGRSPKAWLLRRRLREAERLLRGTDLSILSIALELGFPSSQHFATVFRRHTGRRPSDLRKEPRAG